MECITASPLSDETLNFVLDGLADESDLQHLAECAYCASRLAAMRRFEASLLHKLRRATCPTPDAWASFMMGELPEAEDRTMAEHLRECPRCQSELKMHEEFLKSSANQQHAALPDNVIPVRFPRWLLQATPARTAGSLALKGLRDTDGEYQYDVKSGTTRVFLELKQINSGYLLTGQVIDSENNWAMGIAQLTWGTEERLIALLDESAEFRYEVAFNVPTVTLHIIAKNGVTVVINGITFH